MMIYAAAGLVVAALVAMASGRVDPLLALLVALIFAGILGIAPVDQFAAGLSKAGVITVAAMLVIAKGIVQTGSPPGRPGRFGVDQHRAAGIPPAHISHRRRVAADQHDAVGGAPDSRGAAARTDQAYPSPRRAATARPRYDLGGSVTLIGTSSNLVIAGIAGERGVDMRILSICRGGAAGRAAWRRRDLLDEPARAARRSGRGGPEQRLAR